MISLLFWSIVGIIVIPILIYRFYKGKKLKSLYGVLLLTVIILIWVVPIAINSVFDASLTDVILGFYGDLLSFVGTISLGALALWQNHLYKTEKDETERKYSIPEFKVNLEGDVVTGQGMKLTVTNVCRNYICKVKCGELWLGISQEFVIINAYEKVEIDLNNEFFIDETKAKVGTNFDALIKLKCEDSLGNEHYFVFEIYHFGVFNDGGYIVKNNEKITKEQYKNINNKAFKKLRSTDEVEAFHILKKELFKN